MTTIIQVLKSRTVLFALLLAVLSIQQMYVGLAISFFWYYQDQLPNPLMWALCAFYVWIVWGNVQTIRK